MTDTVEMAPDLVKSAAANSSQFYQDLVTSGDNSAGTEDQAGVISPSRRRKSRATRNRHSGFDSRSESDESESDHDDSVKRNMVRRNRSKERPLSADSGTVAV